MSQQPPWGQAGPGGGGQPGGWPPATPPVGGQQPPWAQIPPGQSVPWGNAGPGGGLPPGYQPPRKSKAPIIVAVVVAVVLVAGVVGLVAAGGGGDDDDDDVVSGTRTDETQGGTDETQGGTDETQGGTDETRGGTEVPDGDFVLTVSVTHPYVGDLAAGLAVLDDAGNPLCTSILVEPDASDNSQDATVQLDASDCAEFYPPGPGQAWFFGVVDSAAEDEGTLDEVVLEGPDGDTYSAGGLPALIPDADPDGLLVEIS
jgi:hypothetical protein